MKSLLTALSVLLLLPCLPRLDAGCRPVRVRFVRAPRVVVVRRDRIIVRKIFVRDIVPAFGFYSTAVAAPYPNVTVANYGQQPAYAQQPAYGQPAAAPCHNAVVERRLLLLEGMVRQMLAVKEVVPPVPNRDDSNGLLPPRLEGEDDGKEGNNAPPEQNNEQAQAPPRQNDALVRMLSVRCASCHTAPGRAGVVLFNTQGQYAPNVSYREMLSVVTRPRKRMPLGMDPLPPEEVALLQARAYQVSR